MIKKWLRVLYNLPLSFKSYYIIDEFLPLQQKRAKREVHPKWFTNNISREIKSQDKLLKVTRKINSDTDWTTYEEAKNNITSLIRNAKQNYFKDKFSEHKNNSSKLWNLIVFV